MEEKYVSYRFTLPIDPLAPLVEASFGETFPSAFPKFRKRAFNLYVQLKTSLMGETSFVSRGILPGDISPLNSVEDLKPYQEYLNLKSSPRSKHLIKLSAETFMSYLPEYHTPEELEEMVLDGLTENQIFGKVMNNAFAFSFWCMLKIVRGERLGVIYNPNKDPHPENPFAEIPMKIYFPNYDNLKNPVAGLSGSLGRISDSETADKMIQSYEDLNKAIESGDINAMVTLSQTLEKYSNGLKPD